MALIVHCRHVAEVDAGDREGSAAVEAFERGQHQFTDRRRADGAVERYGRLVCSSLGGRRAERESQVARFPAPSHDMHFCTLGNGVLER